MIRSARKIWCGKWHTHRPSRKINFSYNFPTVMEDVFSTEARQGALIIIIMIANPR